MPQIQLNWFRAPNKTVVLAALAAGALITAVAWPDVGHSQSPNLGGRWVVQGNSGQLRQMVNQAVEPAIAGLSPDLQQYARQRIAESTWIPATIVINATAQRISVQYQGEENRTFDTAPGQSTNVFSRSGVRAAVTQIFRPDGGIQQQFQAMDGRQINVLTTSGNSLNLSVTIQSPRLGQNTIQFQLTYNRG
jgi:hypothetical protein